MKPKEAARILRDQTIPALRGSGGHGHVEALEAVLEEVGLLRDTCDNLLGATKLPGLPASIHIDGLIGGLEEIRGRLAEIHPPEDERHA